MRKIDDRVKPHLKRDNWVQLLVAAKAENRTGTAQLNHIVEEWLRAREARKLDGQNESHR